MSRCVPANQSRRISSSGRFLLSCVILLVMCNVSWGKSDFRLAVAASLRNPIDEIARLFEQENHIAVRISYGASGSLLAQLMQGAPFDLFLSVDEKYPKRLIEEGLADSLFEFGLGRLVLWVPEDSLMNINQQGMSGLLDQSILKIAIANPKVAPYGMAAVEALRFYGIYEKVLGKLVYGEDISQAMQFVETGAVEAGIIAYSMAISRKGRTYIIPETAHAPLKQVGVILKKTSDRNLAKSFVAFMTKGKGQAVLKRYGYVQ